MPSKHNADMYPVRRISPPDFVCGTGYEGNAAEKSFTTLIYPVCAARRERGGVLEEVKWGIKLITTDDGRASC